MFQSTHPRGVRLRRLNDALVRASFNPRTREGCDSEGVQAEIRAAVSIHAPARGATLMALGDLFR